MGRYVLRVARGCLVLALTLVLVGTLQAQSPPGGTLITVTTTSDVTNGNRSSVASLIANPGPDGISLREAIEATNNDPGHYTIGFAPALAGRTITLGFDLPPLGGGGVTVEGDIDGDGQPDVTLRTTVRSGGSPCQRCGFQIASSGNRLHALALQDFNIGVLIDPGKPGAGLPTAQTLADNAVDGLVMRSMRDFGVEIHSTYSPKCGVPKPRPCRALDRWANTTITGNTIESRATGIAAKINNAGDRVEGATVTDNTIRIVGQDAGIGFETGNDATHAQISGVLIARNSIEGTVGIGINVASGVQRAQANTTDGVQVLDNRVHLVKRGSRFCCQGIVVQAGSDAPSAMFPNVHPLRYPDGNAVRNVRVGNNSVTGTLVWGVEVVAGFGAGGSHNGVESVHVEHNVIRSSTLATGVYVGVGDGTPFKDRYATGNRIGRVSIDANQITIGNASPQGRGRQIAGGVTLLGGGGFGRGGRVSNIGITQNQIGISQVGMRLIGGLESTAHGNRVTCVRLAGNHVVGTRKAVSASSNVGGASGNRASLGGC